MTKSTGCLEDRKHAYKVAWNVNNYGDHKHEFETFQQYARNASEMKDTTRLEPCMWNTIKVIIYIENQYAAAFDKKIYCLLNVQSNVRNCKNVTPDPMLPMRATTGAPNITTLQSPQPVSGLTQ